MLLGPDLAALQEGIGDCEATGTRLPSRTRKPVPETPDPDDDNPTARPNRPRVDFRNTSVGLPLRSTYDYRR